MVVTRSRPPAARILLVLTLLAWPRPAGALPGPEVLVPLLAGGLPLYLLAVALLRGPLRRGLGQLRRRALAVGVVALLALLTSLPAAIAVLLLHLAGQRARQGRRLAAALLAGPPLLALAALAGFSGQSLTPSPASTGADLAEVLRAHPARWPASPDAPPRLVLVLGELEDCPDWSPAHGVVLRPADLPAARPALAALLAEGWSIQALLVPRLSHVLHQPADPRRSALGLPLLEELGIPVLGETAELDSPVARYRPTAVRLWIVLRPRTSPAVLDVPENGRQSLGPVPLVDAKEVATWTARGLVHQVRATTVLRWPTADLPARASTLGTTPLLVTGPDLRVVLAAVRLLRGVGAPVVAASRHRQPNQGPWSPSAPPLVLDEGLILGLVLLATLLSGLLAWCEPGLRRLVFRLAGHRPGWSGPANPDLLLLGARLAPAAALFGILGIGAIPLTWAGWLTPAPFETLLGRAPVLLLLTAGGVALQLGRVRGPGRLVAALLLVALVLLSIPGLVLGPAPCALQLAAVLPPIWIAVLVPWLRLAHRRHRDRRRAPAGGLRLDLSEIPPTLDPGTKARALARLALRTPRVPPACVVWLRGEADAARAARSLRRWLPGHDLILRSSAADEDLPERSAAGQYRTVTVAAGADSGQVAAGLTEVVQSYPAATGPQPVLVMPALPARLGGVAMGVDAAGTLVLIESAAGTDGVTAGREVPCRALVNTASRRVYPAAAPPPLPDRRLVDLAAALPRGHDRPVELEWLVAGERRWWVVQVRPVTRELPLDPAARWSREARAALGALAHDGSGVLLRRVDDSGLPDPAPARTTALWARQWRRDGALGDALRWLGLPRWLVPARLVLDLGGGLYELRPAADRLSLLLLVRLRPGGGRGPVRRAAAVARRLRDADLLATTPATFRQLTAGSIALRLLQPWLPSGPADRTRSPTVRLARALRLGATAAERALLTTRFGHRARHDLDPATPRYDDGEHGDVLAPPPSLPLPATDPANQEAAALWRDLLHDLLSWHVAALRRADPSWTREVPPPDAPPAGGLTAADLDRLALPGLDRRGPDSGRGVWVSGGGPVEGWLTFRCESSPAPDALLALDAPLPETAAHFAGHAAVVAASGGHLSHAAIVARELGVPALFGVAGLTERFAEGQRVQLTAAGEVIPS